MPNSYTSVVEPCHQQTQTQTLTNGHHQEDHSDVGVLELKRKETTTTTLSSPPPPPPPSPPTGWRPTYHLIASHGWLNDPCAPGYIPSKDAYHVGFQWNSKGAEWGDIVWGKAFSKDLVSWEVSAEPSLDRDQKYDSEGVFTGCWTPTAADARRRAEAPEEVTVFYTSVSRLPIHYTKEYHRGCESLSMAASTDGGRSWVKREANPILPGPSAELGDVTGWRDPYVAHWPAMDRLLALRRGAEDRGEKGALYGIISGGVRNKTPTTWLYRVDGEDMAKWEYVAPLMAPGLNFAPSRWTGDLGVNWEVTNFVSLQGEQGSTQGSMQDFLILGAEGCLAPHGGAGTVPGTLRCNRAQLWMAIKEEENASTRKGQEALMEFSYGGVFDHGLYYAANGFWDPVTQQQVVMGWVTEEDLPVDLAISQGWSGCLALPRVVSLSTISHVVRATKTPLQEITNLQAVAEQDDGLFTVTTLAIRPDPRLHKLRKRASRQELQGPRSGKLILPLKTAQWEAHAVFSSVGRSGRVGLKIHHHTTVANAITSLYFAPKEETFFVERPDIRTPASDSSVKVQKEQAPFTLFTTRDAQTGVETEERLTLRVFYDGSVLEVFVNERVVITTRVYLPQVECAGLELVVEDGASKVEEAVVWDGLDMS